MPILQAMPPITIDASTLVEFGKIWYSNQKSLSRTPPYSSGDLGKLFDNAVGQALAVMLGNISLIRITDYNTLLPPQPNCVEVGPVRVIGGVRPQNFDVGYRPDGIRVAFDSKTLNDAKSVGKNWQNMVNDLATEATTVHSRFPHAVVAFMVVIPEPCVSGPVRKAIIETLERLARRNNVEDSFYMAEAISLVFWNPDDGTIDASSPSSSSPIRVEKFSTQVELAYVNRYKGLPPHAPTE